MEDWLRRIRGAIGVGITWGLAWFAVGMVLLLIVGLDAADVPFPLFFGALGFVAGALFSGVVSLLGRNRRFDEMSVPGFAGWGALGGALFSVLFVGAIAVFGDQQLPLEFFAPLFGAAGAFSAGGTLLIARAGEDPDELEAGDPPNRIEGGR